MNKLIIIFMLLFFNNLLVPQVNIEDNGAFFIKAINSSSESEQTEIITKIFSKSALTEVGMDKLHSFIQRMHSDYAPLAYHHSETLTFNKPDGISYVMHIYAKKKESVMWQDFQMRLDPEPPHKLKTIGFIAEVSEPVTLPNGSIEQKETLDWLEKYLEDLKSNYGLFGSILIAKGDKILFQNYYGYENVEKKIPITSKTLFNIASGGKMFAALCIAKLAEENRLSYKDKITKYITGFYDTSDASKVTIHQLISHTSGIAEYWSDSTDETVHSAKNINDHLKLVLKCNFNFEPGSGYQYCNSNYILLGAIIEKVTGKSYYDFVKETVFKPAEMGASGYFNYRSKNLAIPYRRGETENEWIEASHGIKGSSAGGAYSNATDILKFSNALKENKIVSKITLRNLITTKNLKIKSAGEFDYGYGFIVNNSKQENSYGHGGITDGVNFEFRYFPESDITLVIFCNQNNGAYDDLKKNAIKLITGER